PLAGVIPIKQVLRFIRPCEQAYTQLGELLPHPGVFISDRFLNAKFAANSNASRTGSRRQAFRHTELMLSIQLNACDDSGPVEPGALVRFSELGNFNEQSVVF